MDDGVNAEVDNVVVGAATAGASVAGLLPRHASVLVLEAEQRPGFYATGRSAALYAPGYGTGCRALTKASRLTLFDQPREADLPHLVRPRPLVIVAVEGQMEAPDAMHRTGLDTLDTIDAPAREASAASGPSPRPTARCVAAS